MNVCSNFYAYMGMLNIILMLVNFGSENWSRAQGVGPDFYTFPDGEWSAVADIQSTSVISID